MAEGTLTETLIDDVACIYVPVADVYRSIQWYAVNLGLVPSHHNAVRPGMPFVILTYPTDGPAIMLIQAPDTTCHNFYDTDGYERPLLCFSVRDIDRLYRQMQANGVRLEGEQLEERGGCGTNFKFYDPDGNKFDVNQPSL